MDRNGVLLSIAIVALLAAACGGASPVAEPPPPSAALASPTPPASPTASPPPSAVTPSRSPSPAALPDLLEFMDVRSGVRVIVETVGPSRQKGVVAVSVPDRGAYLVQAGTALSISPTAISVAYEGQAVLSPLVSLDDQTPRGIVKQPTDVRVRLRAQLDPVTRTGTATLEHDGATIALDARVPDISDLTPVIDAFERAMLTNDGRLLYSVMNTDITKQYTVEAFERQMSDQSAQVGRVIAIRRGVVSGPIPGAVGYWTVTVLYDTERRAPNGVTSAVRYEAYFIRQTVGWKILFTREL